MPRIYELPTSISNLIAAGEVVERPASVVKELVENSIDAGAKNIVIEIRNGGVSYIRITDDGSGIIKSDVKTAFKRHATSKIKTAEDIFAIGTLGFRGEALAAIASVSRIDIFSKVIEEEYGVHMQLEAGEEQEYEEAGCPNGTTIIVQDLFFNTPARIKFLKNDKTEAAHIADILEHLALSRTDIAIKHIKNGKDIFATNGDGDLKNAIYAVYGKGFSEGMLSVMGSMDNVEITGVITPVNITRGNKNMQNFFINNRYIRSKTLMAAVERAYEGRLMTGRMPACFINLRMPASDVDVNVHPSKLEVKFSNNVKVFDIVYNTITDALNAAGDLFGVVSAQPMYPVVQGDESTYPNEILINNIVNRPSNNIYTEAKNDTGINLYTREKYTYNERFNDLYRVAEPTEVREIQINNNIYDELVPSEKVTAKKYDEEHIVSTQKVNDTNYKIVGEVFKTYIIIERNEEIILIDKHAVHEKIVYNRLKGIKLEMLAQTLLAPIIISLTRKEKAAALEQSEYFAEMGFDIDDFGGSNIVVRQAPSFIDEADIEAVVTQIIDKIITLNIKGFDLYNDVLKSVACKAAIKAGFSNDMLELDKLVRELINVPDLESCPHGRPTTFRISRYELEKNFKRVT